MQKEVEMYKPYTNAVCPPVSSAHNSSNNKVESNSAIGDNNFTCRPSVSMENVRIRYSPAPPIQCRSSSYDVIQCAPSNIHALHDLDSAHTVIPVIPSEKPTMVFESMGTSNDAMENVYKESMKYRGNTVCVFGLNKKRGTAGVLVTAEDKNEIPHHSVSFSFEWSKPVRMDAAKGYEMPFVEARGEIMKQAQKLSFTECAPESVTDEQREKVITPTDEGGNLSLQPVYRWIDGDARDDSSEELTTRFLTTFSTKEDAYIATGAYRWRHESDGLVDERSGYHEFIKLLNDKEAFLRKTYMFFMRQEMDTAERGENAYAYGAFYLPESTFLMNQAAHNKISSAQSRIDPNGDQARESMRFFNGSGITKDRILYKEQLHVTKPLKKEFSADGYAASLMELFALPEYSRDALAKALQKHRQSAFGSHWEPRGNEAREEYRRKKEECIEELNIFLRTGNKFASIQREIRRLQSAHT